MELQLPDQPRCCDSAPKITKVTLGTYIFAVLHQDVCFLMFLERYMSRWVWKDKHNNAWCHVSCTQKSILPSHAAGCFFTFPQGRHSRHAWKIHHNPFCALKRFLAQKTENKSRQMYLARPWNTNIQSESGSEKTPNIPVLTSVVSAPSQKQWYERLIGMYYSPWKLTYFLKMDFFGRCFISL